MAFINYQDPKDGEANSPLIAGITEGLKKISQVLNMEIQTLVDSPMEKVPYYDDNGDEINILYQSPAGNKCWLPSPPPIIKKNGIALTESTYTIDYVGGSIFFSRNSQQLDSDVFTVDVTIIKPSSAVLNESNEKIEDLVSSTASYKGYYETLDELKVAHPRSNLGDFAIIGGEIDTIAVWDKESNDWKMITSDIDLSGYYTKAEVENIKTNLQNNIDNTNTALTEGLAEKVDTTAFDEAIAKKVDTTAFDEKMTAVDTSIASKADKTLENVSDDDLKKRVQGLDIGGGLKNLKDNLTSDGAIYGVNTVSDPTTLGIPQGKNSFQFGESTISGNNNSMAIGENSIVNFQNTGVPITRIVNDGVAKKITVGFDFLTDGVKNNLILARDYLNTQGKSFDIYLNAKLITPDDTGAFDFVKVTVSNTDGNNPLNIDMFNLDLFIADYDNFAAKYSVDDLSFFVLVGNDELTFANKDNAVSTGFALGDGNLNQGNLTNSSIVSGSMNVNMSSNSIVAGRKNTVSKSDNSVVTGEANISSGDKYSFLSGNKNNVQNSNSSIVTGTNNFVISSGDSIVSGNTNVVMSDRSIVNGQYNKIFGYSNNLTLGVGNCSNGENVYNIGTNNVGVTTRESINSGINIGSGNLSNSACSAGIVESYVVGDTSTTIVVNLDYDFADSPIMNFLKVGDNLLFIATEASKSTQSRTIESIDVDNHSFTVPNFSDTTFVPRAFSAERKNIDANGVQNFNLGSENTLLGRNSVSFGSGNINKNDYSYVLGKNNTCNSYSSVIFGRDNVTDTSNSAIGTSFTSGFSNIVLSNSALCVGSMNVIGRQYNSGVIYKVDYDNNAFYIDNSSGVYSDSLNTLVGSYIYIMSANDSHKKYKILEKDKNWIKVDSDIMNNARYFSIIQNHEATIYQGQYILGRSSYSAKEYSISIGVYNMLNYQYAFAFGYNNEIANYYNTVFGQDNYSSTTHTFSLGQGNFANGGGNILCFGSSNCYSGSNTSFKIVSFTKQDVFVTLEKNSNNWTQNSFSKLNVDDYVILISSQSKLFKAKIANIDTENYIISLDKPLNSYEYKYMVVLKKSTSYNNSFILGGSNYVTDGNSFCFGARNELKNRAFVYGENNIARTNYSAIFGTYNITNSSSNSSNTISFGLTVGRNNITTRDMSFSFGEYNVNGHDENTGIIDKVDTANNTFYIDESVPSYSTMDTNLLVGNEIYIFAAKEMKKYKVLEKNGNAIKVDDVIVASPKYFVNMNKFPTTYSPNLVFGRTSFSGGKSAQSAIIGLDSKLTGNGSFIFGNYNFLSGNNAFMQGFNNFSNSNLGFCTGSRNVTNGDGFFATFGTKNLQSVTESSYKIVSCTLEGVVTVEKDTNKWTNSSFAKLTAGEYVVLTSLSTTIDPFKARILSVDTTNYTITLDRPLGYTTYTHIVSLKSQASAEGYFNYVFGFKNYSVGTNSFCVGASNTVKENGFVFGQNNTIDTGSFLSIVIGESCKTSASYSAAIGSLSTASGSYSLAFGYATVASGTYSLALGSSSNAIGIYSFAFGNNGNNAGVVTKTKANGGNSFAFGSGASTASSAKYAFSFGKLTSANAEMSFAFGEESTVGGAYSFAFGKTCKANEFYALAFGLSSEANGQCSLAFGFQAKAISIYGISIGYNTQANAESAIAIGNSVTNSGNYSFSFGKNITNSGGYSLAVGNGVTVTNTYAVSLGNATKASGVCSFTAGNNCTASGSTSFSFGSSCISASAYCISMGVGCNAAYSSAISIGSYNIANGTSILIGSYLKDNSKDRYTIIGKYNVLPTVDGTLGGYGGDAFTVGNGTSESTRSNCFRVDWNGRVFSKGAYNTSGADLAETIEWWDKNPDSEDRRGRFVTLDGNYIKFADTPEQVFGCVSSNPSLIGNNESETWHDMYLKDIWGELILQEITVPDEYETTYEDYTDVDENGVEVTKTSEVKTLVRESYKTMAPIVNPKYNPDMEYKPRSERKEYCITGREGQIVMCDDGTCEVGKLCNTTYGGYATKSDKGYMVMERIDSSHIKIYFGWIKTNEELGIIS